MNVIPLYHNRRNVHIETGKNHCISFSDDGSYIIYEFDNKGMWVKIITVNCSHWQNGGLIAAQIDTNARNVLTLTRRGNFLCTSFK